MEKYPNDHFCYHYYLCIILAIVLTTACSEMITTEDREREPDLELMPRSQMSRPEAIFTAILGKTQGFFRGERLA